LQHHCTAQVGHTRNVLIETATTGRCADFTPVTLQTPHTRGIIVPLHMVAVADNKVVAG
jgi:hypothetical protein